MMNDPAFTGPLAWVGMAVILLVFFFFMGRAAIKDRERLRAEHAVHEQPANHSA